MPRGADLGRALVLLSTLLGAGCSAITSVDDLTVEVCGESPVEAGSDLRFEVENTADYSEHNLYGLVVREDGAEVSPAHGLMRFAVAGETPSTMTFFAPNVFSAGTHRIRFFFDMNDTGTFEFGEDAGWEAKVCSDGSAQFDTSTDPEGLNNIIEVPVKGGFLPFRFAFTEFGVHLMQQFELRVFDASSGQCVASVMHPKVDSDLIRGLIGPLVEPGSMYRIDYYADANRNGRFDPPMDDHAWSETQRATLADGLFFEDVHQGDFAFDLEWDEP